MSFDVEPLGVAGPIRRHVVTASELDAYAAATDDVPGGPVFTIVPVWPTIAPASRSVASDDVRSRVLHYEHDIVLHRPIEVGMSLEARTTPVALLGRPNGTALVLRVETRDAAGDLVNEQYVTEFFRGVEAERSVGDRPPGHRLDVAGTAPIAAITYPVADDQTVRYAAASGDDFAIHTDDEFARAVGLPGRVVHGLCSLAFAGRAVLEAAGVADPRAVRRLAVRFSAPLFPGDALTTRVWRTEGGYGFESVDDRDTVVLKDGRMELV
jgi:acyl dehydratase